MSEPLSMLIFPALIRRSTTTDSASSSGILVDVVCNSPARVINEQLKALNKSIPAIVSNIFEFLWCIVWLHFLGSIIDLF
jgi:hypothetical protein